MGEKTGIEWADSTWNPWHGCRKVSPGCKNCYMYREKRRWGQDPTQVVRSSKSTFNAPLKWSGPRKVFVCSWSDFFIADADTWRDEAWDIIGRTPHLTYLILTKRPEEMSLCLPDDWGDGWPNVWLGVSVENSDYLWRIEFLDGISALVKFVSYEPALGPVDFTAYTAILDWIISGGESMGRDSNLDWFRAVRDVCQENDVAYFHKQRGGRRKIDGAWGGRVLDGRTWDEFPVGRDETITLMYDCELCGGRFDYELRQIPVALPSGEVISLLACELCAADFDADAAELIRRGERVVDETRTSVV